MKNADKLVESLLKEEHGTAITAEQMDPIARQAVGHFIEGWGEDDAPAILNPWKHRYTENRQLDLLPEWSELCLDWEAPLRQALQAGGAQETFHDFNEAAKPIIAKL